MSICPKCSGVIDAFRNINGNNVPFHNCTNRDNDRIKPKSLLNEEIRNILNNRVSTTRRVCCSHCGKSVFYYKNENGSKVFFEELGSPWPKHNCNENTLDYKYKTLINEPQIDKQKSNSKRKPKKDYSKPPYTWDDKWHNFEVYKFDVERHGGKRRFITYTISGLLYDIIHPVVFSSNLDFSINFLTTCQIRKKSPNKDDNKFLLSLIVDDKELYDYTFTVFKDEKESIAHFVKTRTTFQKRKIH